MTKGRGEPLRGEYGYSAGFLPVHLWGSIPPHSTALARLRLYRLILWVGPSFLNLHHPSWVSRCVALAVY